MGTKNNPGDYDCYDKAEPDEPMFVLLGRDIISPALVMEWANTSEVRGADPAKVAEARACAAQMREWRAEKSYRNCPGFMRLDDTNLCICGHTENGHRSDVRSIERDGGSSGSEPTQSIRQGRWRDSERSRRLLLPGKVPLSVKDETAQPILWAYALVHRAVDSDFSDDLQTCLVRAGFDPGEELLERIGDLAEEVLRRAARNPAQETPGPFLSYVRVKIDQVASSPYWSERLRAGGRAYSQDCRLLLSAILEALRLKPFPLGSTTPIPQAPAERAIDSTETTPAPGATTCSPSTVPDAAADQ